MNRPRIKIICPLATDQIVITLACKKNIDIARPTLTTIAGLFSLATGLGGKSLIWGPVAASIVWGLGFSTVLTLIVIPLLYRIFMGRGAT